jgi:drug/metabolite transporter (DMT)-like permease
MPVIVFLLYREKPSVKEILGTLLSLAGAGFLAGPGFRLTSGNSLGDLISFASMVLFAGYLALAKGRNRHPSVWVYVVPLYLWAGVLCMGAAFFVSPPWTAAHGTRDVAMALALALVCTVGGHSLLNYGMRVLKSQLVSLMVVTQALWAPLLGYLFFSEIPGPAFFPAAALVGAGIVLAVFKKSAPS